MLIVRRFFEPAFLARCITLLDKLLSPSVNRITTGGGDPT